MKNVVDLEQLNYRDAAIKEYIDEKTASGGGGGSSSGSLYCELEVAQDHYTGDGLLLNKI